MKVYIVIVSEDGYMEIKGVYASKKDAIKEVANIKETISDYQAVTYYEEDVL